MSKQRQARAASALVAPARVPFDQHGAEVGAVNGTGLRFGSAVLGRQPIQAVEVRGVHPVVAERADEARHHGLVREQPLTEFLRMRLEGGGSAAYACLHGA